MISIPPEYLPLLAALNIQDPADSRWKHLDPWPIKFIRSHHFCPCATPPRDVRQKVDLSFKHLAGRMIFIGQCPLCHTVYWRDAIPETR